MKYLILTPLLLLITFTLPASHLKGGYITYRWLTGMTYEITLNTFSDPTSIADPNTQNANVDFGDNASTNVARSSTILVNADLRQNTYVATHTFPTEGTFIVSYTDANLIDGIRNVNAGNSKDYTLRFDVRLTIDFTTPSTCPQPSGLIPEVTVIGGSQLNYNPSFTARFQGPPNSYDSLSYSLISPGLPNYSFPGNLSIDPYNGMILWGNAPFVTGPGPDYYLICYEVDFWAGKYKVRKGSLTVIQMLKVVNYPVRNVSLVSFPGTDVTARGWNRKIVTAASPFSQDLSYPKDSVLADSLSVFSELSFSLADSTSPTLPKLARFTLNFAPDSTFIPRNWPYFITLRRTFANTYKTTRDYSFAIYYGASVRLSISDMANGTGLRVFPNPCNGNCNFITGEEQVFRLILTDMQGKLIFTTNSVKGKFSFDGLSLPAGNYFYLLQSENGVALKGKLIVEH